MAAYFGRRLRKGATTTALAAAAVAALSASQAPGITSATAGDGQGVTGATVPPGAPVTGNSPYYTDLPPLNTPHNPGSLMDQVANGPAEAGIPASVRAAYKQAERTIAASDPACRLPWQLLAAIGKVESGQARGGRVDADGTTLSPILGPVLNGVGFADISDTDNGAYDGDPVHDRAVGPMQFIPSTWETWGQDANADGRRDPDNIYDAALAAGRYLCAGGRDLGVEGDLEKAILGYNHSREYLRTVLSWFEYYKRGSHEVPDATGVLPVEDRPDSAGAQPDRKPTPKPSEPGTTPTPEPKPGPSQPAGGSDTPPAPSPTTPAPVQPARIEDAGTGALTAMAGREFDERATVRVEDSAGTGLSKQPVRFAVIGDTDTRFPGGRSGVTLVTGLDGTATAPALVAGEKTGAFLVRATVDGRSLPPVGFAATVTRREADKVVHTEEKAQTAAPCSEFADRVEVKATYQGGIASGVAVTATMISSTGDPATNAEGPYFKDADGNPVRSLTELKTDADGVLKLPKIFADGTEGTFLLRLTTAGGAHVDIELTVALPTVPTTPAPSPSL